jgi:SNF2 family DNA or RNA helicase
MSIPIKDESGRKRSIEKPASEVSENGQYSSKKFQGQSPAGSRVEDQLWEKLKLKPEQPEIQTPEQLTLLSVTSAEPFLSSASILKWAMNPFPYQLDGINVLLSRDSILLADDMGLGKTLQAVSALRIMIYQRRIETALIIVPAGLIIQWRKEIRLLAPELKISTVHGPSDERAYQWRVPANVFLTGYETLRGDFTSNPQSPPRRRVWDLVILDEAQKIKNRETELARKCKRIPRKRAWALTGTPLENDPDDLASILEFTTAMENEREPQHIVPGDRMTEMHKKMQLRRKKAEVLADLPPKIVSTISLQLLPEQRSTYDKVEKEGILQLKERGIAINVSNILELILRLKQICNFCPVSGASSKMEDIRDKMHTLVAEGYRAIVFSQFTDKKYGVQAIYQNLRPFNPLVFTGGLDALHKEMVIRSFKSNPERKVLILSLMAGGQGLNLQDASYVFHFDRWWNPAVEHQAEDRTHRPGQKLPVHIYKYTCENTIEERIENILQKKQRLFDDLVDDVSIDISTRFTAEELFGLFGLTPPSRYKGK